MKIEDAYDGESLKKTAAKQTSGLAAHIRDASENWPFPPGEEFRGAAQQQREIDDRIISNGREHILETRRIRDALLGD